MIDEKKLINYINAEINPYGKPFNGTAYEFGLCNAKSTASMQL